MGGLMDANAFVRDLSLGAGHPFTFEFFDTSDTRPSPGHRISDPITTENHRAVGQWVGPAAFTSSREWTLTLLVVDGAGRPVEGAGVAVRDRQGSVAFTASSDAAGVASGVVVETVVRNGPVFDGRGPFTISVTKAGVGTVDGSVAVAGRTALRVDLAREDRPGGHGGPRRPRDRAGTAGGRLPRDAALERPERRLGHLRLPGAPRRRARGDRRGPARGPLGPRAGRDARAHGEGHRPRRERVRRVLARLRS